MSTTAALADTNEALNAVPAGLSWMAATNRNPNPVRIIRAYKFALEPTPAQERALRSHAGASRVAWNWGLAKCQERYAAEGSWYSGIDLHRMWNAAKKG